MRHIETHTNAMAFQCEICFRGYKYKKSLTEHKAKVHEIGHVNVSQRNKFVCYLCQKSFYANSKLEKHPRTTHSGKSFQCSNCKKRLLASHM